MNSARAARPPRRAASRPPLMRESAERRVLSSPIAMPEENDSRVSAARSSSVAPVAGTSTRLEAPPEIRKSGRAPCGSSSTHSSRRPPAASERSSGTGCDPSHTSGATPRWNALRSSWSRVMMSVRSMALPSASCAPSAMAVAALPTAATETGAGGGAAVSAAATQWRPCTRARPACRSSSSSARRGSEVSASLTGVPRKSRILLDSVCSPGAASAIFWGGLPHHLELATPVTAGELGRVRALELQPLEIFGADIARHVLTREARGVELLDTRILVLARSDQILEVLVDEPVGADDARHLLHRAPARHQLARRRHVDAVDVRKAHRRCRGGEIHLGSTGFAGELDDLRRGGATHDRVIDQQHPLATEFEVDGIQLAVHGLLALLLSGHDESAADVAVLDEALAVLDAEPLRELQRAGTAGIRNGNHHIDVVCRPLAQDLVRQAIAHAHARAVDGDVVDLRVGAGEINILEDAGGVPPGGDALLRMQPALLIDEHRLTRCDIAHQAERECIERHALGGEHPLDAPRRAPLTEHQRTDPVRVAETENSMADDHGDHRIATAAAAVDRIQCREHIRGGDACAADALQLGGEDVQQHLRIGGGVQVPAILADEDLRELGGVGEVAVVAKADAVGCIDVEGLCLGSVVAARRRVAHVAYAGIALE